MIDPGNSTTLLGGPGDDIIRISDTSGIGVYADGGDGSDTYIVQVGNLLGPVTIADSGNSGTDTVTIQGGAAPLTVEGNVISQGVQTLTLATVPSTLTVEAPAGTALPVVKGAALVAPDPLEPGQTVLVVGGTSVGDAITINPAHQGVGLTVALNGKTLGTFNPTGWILVQAFEGNDDVQVAGQVGLRAELFGGEGNDRLKGGSGNDRLLGGIGDDLLVGGQGRDLLIGGLGADKIVGNADDDILIAGATAFDANWAALDGLMAEWTSNRSYAVRVANLRDGSGSLERSNGTYFLNDTTASDDGVVDVLTGDSGLDWFLLNQDTGVHDQITDLNAKEFADDLDFINS